MLAIASLSLIISFFTPIWSIQLEAPQYPEGLGIKIHLHTIQGEKSNDLESINGLNHYIGMQRIVPDAIPELKLMPYIVGAFIAFGLLFAAIGRRTLAWVWVAVFIVAGVAGMWDFYLWEYDYGHNLDPHAAIRIDDMNYQPPLIGSKQLLNFRAISLPDVGGYIIGASVLLGAFAALLKGRDSIKSGKSQTINFAGPVPETVMADEVES
ncbi:hypothetical protein MASR2M18_13690 [Ignavibacteria bacterium]